ncbi:MAG: hypothetical protein A3C07_03445 [Candidatus Sungbacteria bacterium RIFCSPHIGHO2_02_FULL_47_11]|uniref:ATPase F1/V1/A1 complex alpha/beta subunit nucleotide-binding domain-containing protein n=1 Tax=Candidatus Sungbacteria bacterium RIFCSPHIGHO2_02_FULL_47_11 TaxID=1802270 RepID=A0A1G2KLP5_9BACT|nr:MAG: hypothetical protein A3C07_03445 [Candidatus Sungbacteria bacterium RIFCSPHIGHO2_02_FULL_47_11]
MKDTFQQYLTEIGEIGFVERVVSSLVYANGLPGVRLQEMVLFESGEVGRVTGLGESVVELVNFSRKPVAVGTRIARTNHLLEVPVGEELLGSVINPLGESLDPSSPLPPTKERRSVDAVPLGIQARLRIKKQCTTGVSLVDRLLPLGLGQRELVLGDQKTGKSRFLLRALFSQVKEGAIGVYAVIGKGRIAAKQVEQAIREFGIAKQVVIVVASADEPASMISLAPYTAMTVAEFFRDQGRNVIVVLDDLSLHAKMYRELALLGHKFPGRNSYPGDIFHIHARLLERAGSFTTPHGEAAITCLPVIETPRGDMTGYIATNLMSITDGHLFFDHILFAEGRRPAIDPFLSVTRVGRQTQTPLEREISSELLTFLKIAERLHAFASFGAELGEHIKEALARERRIMQFFDQTAYEMVPINVQLLLFGLVWGNRWRDKMSVELHTLIERIIKAYGEREDFHKKVDGIVAGRNSIKELVERTSNFDFASVE